MKPNGTKPNRKKTNRIVCLLAAAVLFLGVLCLPTNLRAGTLDESMALKVGALANLLKSKSIDSVHLNPIDAGKFSDGKSLVSKSFAEHCEQNNIGIDSDADVRVTIKLRFEHARLDEPTPGIKLLISLEDASNGLQLHNFSDEFDFLPNDSNVKVKVDKDEGILKFEPTTLDKAEEVQTILSVPVAIHNLPAAELGSEKVKVKANQIHLDAIRDSYNEPNGKTFVRGSRASSTAEHIFEVELYRTLSTEAKPPRDSYKPIPLSIDSKGFAFAELSLEDKIAVKVYNNRPVQKGRSGRVAAEFRLDGINSFAFSKAKGLAGYYEIKNKKAFFLRGFHYDRDDATDTAIYKHFKIVNFADTNWLKAQETAYESPSTQYGSITVNVMREFPRFRKLTSKGTKDPGVGEGDAFETKEKTSKMKVGKMIESIVIRYQKPKK